MEVFLVNIPMEVMSEAMIENVLRAASRVGVMAVGSLFRKRGAEIEVTKEMIRIIGRTERVASYLMQLLLSNRGPGYKLSGEVMIAAVGNERDGGKLVHGIVHSGIDVDVTEGVAIAVAGNEGCGLEVLQLLVSQAQVNFGLGILESGKVEEAARQNANCGTDILELFDK